MITDRWAAGSTYEEFMGRWSRKLAPRFVSWQEVPDSAHWLDVGCGTGALVDAILHHGRPASVVGCDPAEPFVEFARSRARDERISYVVAGIGSLPRRADGYGSVTSLFALNFFPDPPSAVQEMRSIAAAGGTVSAGVWDYREGMEFLRHFWNAAKAVDESARERDEGERFPLCRPEALLEVFHASGLHNVRCEPIEITTEFASFEDYWRPFLGGTGPAPSYVASLDDTRRQELARRLEPMLPRGAGGTIPLKARAWAVRGTAD